jgi:hypothetical protein
MKAATYVQPRMVDAEGRGAWEANGVMAKCAAYERSKKR